MSHTHIFIYLSLPTLVNVCHLEAIFTSNRTEQYKLISIFGMLSLNVIAWCNYQVYCGCIEYRWTERNRGRDLYTSCRHYHKIELFFLFFIVITFDQVSFLPRYHYTIHPLHPLHLGAHWRCKPLLCLNCGERTSSQTRSYSSKIYFIISIA